MTELSEAKQKLLAQRLGARASTPRRPDPIPARPAGPAPLSAGQRALLYEHRVRDDEAIYNIVFAHRLLGHLDRERFIAALTTVVERHETLHLRFDRDRQPLAPSEALMITELELDQAGFDELARQEASRRFDLETGPLVRAALVRLGEDLHGLVLALHHVASDAASLSNLWRELDLAYCGHPLPEITTTYSDHALWQEERITDHDIDFWIDQLGPRASATELALEVPARPEADGYLTVPLSVDPPALGPAIRPTSFFLGTFAALLQRYADTDDVTVAMAASTRDHPAVEGLIGYFLNVLPLRLGVDPAHTPGETARAVDEALASGLRHRHVPLARIASERRKRGGSDQDLARVMFVYDEPQGVELGSLEVDGELIHPGPSVTDLTLFVRPRADRFDVSVEWSGARYRRHDMEHLAAEFVAMAERAAHEPARSWLDCPTVPDMIGPPLTADLDPIPNLFTAHASSSPNAPALRCGDARVTYGELHERALGVANGLSNRGIEQGDRVAVVLERSIDLIASILGVQLLGAAYVPVDPSYPAERIAHLTNTADVALSVTEVSDPARSTVSVADLLTNSSPGEARPVQLDDPAYVIFTSGSTGRPRGVLVDHRRLASSTLGRFDAYDESPGVFLLPSSVGFDSSVAGLFWTLAAGGEIVLPTESEVHDIDALASLVAEANVTHTLMVPSLYRAILERASEQLSSLRHAIVAGEACPSAVVETHHTRLPDTQLSNEYGPTETTVWASFHRCRPNQRPVPIGGPAPGVRLRVVDRWLRPRPPGASGELAIAGSGVTDGYLGGDEESAGRFIDDPTTGERFYLSGDAVRVNEGGDVVFLGRLDDQVSIGGTRVEPEEVESCLLAESGVTAAIVRAEVQLDQDPFEALSDLDSDVAAEILREAGTSEEPTDSLLMRLAESSPSRQLLVAYVEGTGLDTHRLRDAAKRRLPAAMVPDVFEVVERLARTPHGKIDRKALPVPVRRRPPVGTPPSSGDADGMVAKLVDAYRRVLDLPEVGPDTDFFDAGGDSLRAVEMVVMLEDELGRRIPISALVAGRTPSALAALIGSPVIETAASDGIRTSHVVPLRPDGSGPPLIFMPPGGGNLIAFDPLLQALEPGMPVIGFDLPGADRDEELPVSVEDLCDTYMPQLRAAVPTGPYRFLGWSFGGVAALELAQRLEAEGEVVDFIGMIDTYVPGFQRAGRDRTYRLLIENRDVKGFAVRVFRLVRGRVKKRIVAAKGRRAAAGKGSLAPADRDRWLTMKIDAFVERYDAKPYGGPVLFFAARNTPVWRTVEPWSERLADMTVVELDGTHDGDEGLLSGERAVQMAVAISERLR